MQGLSTHYSCFLTITEGEESPENYRDVWIEDDVWVGCAVTIFKGVRIGKGIIGAGSVVTRSSSPCLQFA